jgi:gliding motility-associated-like protein
LKEQENIEQWMRETFSDFHVEVPSTVWSVVANKLTSIPGMVVKSTLMQWKLFTILLFSATFLMFVIINSTKTVVTDSKSAIRKNANEQTNRNLVIPSKQTEQVNLFNKQNVKTPFVSLTNDSVSYSSLEAHFQDTSFNSFLLIEKTINDHSFSKSETTSILQTQINEDNLSDQQMQTGLLLDNTDVYISDVASILNLPNVFTPNGDGSNDYFFIPSIYLADFNLVVLNKDNMLVFSSDNPAFKWDGNLPSGLPVPDGMYLYYLTAKDVSGKPITHSSFLKLIR